MRREDKAADAVSSGDPLPHSEMWNALVLSPEQSTSRSTALADTQAYKLIHSSQPLETTELWRPRIDHRRNVV